ncbi:hypothetical protein QOT17_003696 [Balamuthia mandrillaris]
MSQTVTTVGGEGESRLSKSDRAQQNVGEENQILNVGKTGPAAPTSAKDVAKEPHTFAGADVSSLRGQGLYVGDEQEYQQKRDSAPTSEPLLGKAESTQGLQQDEKKAKGGELGMERGG